MSAKTRRVESRLFLVMKARLLNLPIKAWIASTLALLFWTRLEMLWRWQKKKKGATITGNNYVSGIMLLFVFQVLAVELKRSEIGL